MKLAITGGAGFIGSNFIYHIEKNRPDYKIINIDALTYAGNLKNLNKIINNKNYKFYKCDITNIKDLKIIFEKENFDYVLNFAAETHVDRSIENPSVFVTTNVLGTQNLLSLSEKFKVKKYLQISTDEVYGSLGDTGFFTENTPLSPNSPYSASKTSADLMVQAFNHTYGLHTLITRCSNNYGPYQFPEKLIPLLINNAKNDKQIPVYGDGTNIRDWLYVEDHCSAILTVLENGSSGSVYNIGGNNEKRNIDLIKTILAKMNKSNNLITFVKDRPGHDKRYAIDPAKIKDELGWEPKFNFDDAIEDTINWYLTNSEWLDSVISKDYLKYYDMMYSKR